MSITYKLKPIVPQVLHEPTGDYRAANIKALIDLTIDAANNVQRCLGLGTSKATFRKALEYELFIIGLPFISTIMIPIKYKSQIIKMTEYFDLVIDQQLGVMIDDTFPDQDDQTRKSGFLLKHSDMTGVIAFNTYTMVFRKNVPYVINTGRKRY